MSRASLLCSIVLALCVFESCFALHGGIASLKQYARYVERKQAEEAKLLPAVEDHWFTQKLDHFNHQDLRTWQQRYMVNDTFWNPDLNGPVFLQIGGEGAISPGYVLTMEMVHSAQLHGALVIALEHRFYGKSQPLEDLSTPNLQYLSSQQALADVANFITTFKKDYPNVQFITFGCSYPGNLAAWFRLKYPHLTTASVASSAPVQATLDFHQYLDVVDQSLQFFTGKECDERIQDATTQVQSMLTSSSGQEQLQKDFNTCSKPDNWNDISTFMSALMGNWMGTVQYNDEGGNPIDINFLCNIMNNGSMDAYTAYREVNGLFLKLTGASCLDISYDDMIKEMQDTKASETGVGIRQWVYQTCTEMAYFQTTDSKEQPFGHLVPVTMSLKMCNDTYQIPMNVPAAVNQTNTFYGGNKPHGATNIMFVNGSIDPWHSLSVFEQLSETLQAILIEGTAHCANTDAPYPGAPPGLAEAQEAVNRQIGIWLSQGNQ